jgi:hypothetical protein
MKYGHATKRNEAPVEEDIQRVLVIDCICKTLYLRRDLSYALPPDADQPTNPQKQNQKKRSKCSHAPNQLPKYHAESPSPCHKSYKSPKPHPSSPYRQPQQPSFHSPHSGPRNPNNASSYRFSYPVPWH